MIRCITNEQVVLFASECEDESTRKLSRIGSLLCPNCLKGVRFNNGPIKGAYFSHLPDAQCVVTNYEKETKQHLQGKDMLFKWLTTRFKDAIVELEVYIPETHQIADILVTHTNGKAKGMRWAFEFQHSPLSSNDWEQRHNLYRAANIHDFWILDADKFLLFSNSKDPYIQKARRRKDPVETIFSTTGFCYFLKLDTSETTIDFSFRYKDIRGEDKYGRKFPPQEYKFHAPHDHSSKLSDIGFVYNNEFNFAALTFKNIADGVSTRFKAKIRQFEKEKEQKWNDELQVRARRKKEFAVKNYGEDFSSYMWSFMKANKEDIKDDVFNLSEEEFFSKYNKYAKKLQSFGEEIIRMEDSTILNHSIILKLYNKEEVQKLSFLEEQQQTLEIYLTNKYSQQIKMINYVLSNYDSLLEDLTSRNPKIISKKLSEVNYRINPYKKEPTKFDYAFEYHQFELKEQVDELLKKVQESLTFPAIDISKLL
ncbi:competence protein CoiA [Bacillus sp. USDA818B3_A]|uniref:competence protein CoiA n=1 Tax=Bacillus sp. USDA818B3_A TaxID=2698834 RepID=UPI0013710B58|nr:competence protein CoiA family protein [Bacillus sp. USDA818B3_A]